MPLQSFSACPSCGSSMDMKKQNGLFTCPLCGCGFRHNWKAWIIGIPMAVGLAYGVFMLWHSGRAAALIGAFFAFILASKMGLYKIVTERRTIPGTKAFRPKPATKESKWFIVFLAILLLGIAAGAFFL
jgi:hypothetical protein